ncbi:MAG TPA: M4 family peptidase, partial [Duganella sp.]|nr:M4 family peptidase [Duganella sp.]
MNLRKTLLTASVVAALPILATNAAHAAGPLMAAPVNLASPQESAGLVAKLTALDAQRGGGGDNGFRIASQHPGVVGQKITRAQHTYKGLRVFGSESVVVTNSAGDIVSESVADRRAGLNANGANAGAESGRPL